MESTPPAPGQPDTVVVSCIQPSGELHIGNYFGAIRQHIAFHDKHESYFFIVNYHALTTVRDAEALRRNTLDVAITYLALGFDRVGFELFCLITFIIFHALAEPFDRSAHVRAHVAQFLGAEYRDHDNEDDKQLNWTDVR